MGGEYLMSLSAEKLIVAGVSVGDEVEVCLKKIKF
jgi:hypothetical protein